MIVLPLFFAALSLTLNVLTNDIEFYSDCFCYYLRRTIAPIAPSETHCLDRFAFLCTRIGFILSEPALLLLYSCAFSSDF